MDAVAVEIDETLVLNALARRCKTLQPSSHDINNVKDNQSWFYQAEWQMDGFFKGGPDQQGVGSFIMVNFLISLPT